MKRFFVLSFFILIAHAAFTQDKLTGILTDELNRNFEHLKKMDVPAYYLSYRVNDIHAQTIVSSFGSIINNSAGHQRIGNVNVRVGDYVMDNMRMKNFMQNANVLAFEDSPQAIKKTLWKATDDKYKEAIKNLANVKTNANVNVANEDKSNDFSTEKVEKYFEKPFDIDKMTLNTKEWTAKLNKYSKVFSEDKSILQNQVVLSAELIRKYFVDTEGRQIEENVIQYRLTMQISADRKSVV